MTDNVEEVFRDAEARYSGSENTLESEEGEEVVLTGGVKIGLILLATLSFALVLVSSLRSIGFFEGGAQ